MADVQLENGYTKIANELLEVMALTKLSPIQYRILFIIWRFTYGFNRRKHDLSLQFIANATNYDKRQIQRELKKLEKSKIIIQLIKNGTSRSIEFNKNYSQWVNVFGNSTNGNSTNGNSIKGTVEDFPNGSIGNLTNQERNNKEKYKEKDFYFIFNYYLSLNLVQHRAFTKDMERAVSKAIINNKYDIEYCKTLLDRHKKVVELTKSSEYPVRARGLAEFFGQKVYGGTHLICSEYEEGGKYFEQYLKPAEKKEPPKLRMVFRDDW